MSDQPALVWRLLPEDPGEELIGWSAYSPVLQEDNVVLLTRTYRWPGRSVSLLPEKTYPEGTELFMITATFLDGDGERIPHTDSLVLPLMDHTDAVAYSEVLHRNALEWVDEHPEWWEQKRSQSEAEWWSRIFRPMLPMTPESPTEKGMTIMEVAIYKLRQLRRGKQ